MLRHTLTISCLIFSLGLNLSVNAEVYKTVDKNGRVTYTDVPPANNTTKPIELKTINSIPAPAPIPTDNLSHPTTAPQATAYQVQIAAPENGKTLLADERSITVSVSLNSNLQNGDLLAYKLDGATLTTSSELTYIIVEPPRGEHTLTVEVVDTDGNNVAQSDAITVVVMRPLPKPKATPMPKK